MTGEQTFLSAPSQYWRFALPGGKVFCLWTVVIMSYTAGVLYVDDHYFPTKQFLEVDTITITSVVMGTLLVFRTNSAYDRWWEARKLWGQLVNESRNLAIKCREYVSGDSGEKKAFCDLVMEFANALKDHLRYQAHVKGVPEPSAHMPFEITSKIYNQLRSWSKSNKISEFDLIQFDSHARALMDICGGCERISRSPIAGSYKVLLRTGITMYFIWLPWLVVPTFDWWTLGVVAISCFFVLGLEMLAEEVEQPFGDSPNDLPLDTICSTIKKSMEEELSAVGRS